MAHSVLTRYHTEDGYTRRNSLYSPVRCLIFSLALALALAFTMHLPRSIFSTTRSPRRYLLRLKRADNRNLSPVYQNTWLHNRYSHNRTDVRKGFLVGKVVLQCRWRGTASTCSATILKIHRRLRLLLHRPRWGRTRCRNIFLVRIYIAAAAGSDTPRNISLVMLGQT